MKTKNDLTSDILYHLVRVQLRSYSDIAYEYHTTKETVRHLADKAGLSRSSRQARPVVREEIERMFAEGKTDVEMAEHFQVGLRRLQALRMGLGLTRACRPRPGMEGPSVADNLRWLKQVREQERKRPNHVYAASSLESFSTF